MSSLLNSASEFCMMPSGLIVPGRIAERALPLQPTGIDLFSGAGGFSIGMIKAGFEVVAAVEHNCDAALTYATNLCRYGEFTMHFATDDDRKRMEKVLAREFKAAGVTIKDGKIAAGKKPIGSLPLAGQGWISGEPRSVPGVSHLFIGDIRKLTAKLILKTIGMKKGDLDVVFGGPPCQGFSTAGKRNVYDPRNSLVFEFARMICDFKPKTMIMEDVPNILNMVTPEGFPVVDQLCAILEKGSFAGFDAFKAALKNRPGAMSAMRSRTTGKKDDKKKSDAAADRQKDLFAEAE